MKILSQLAFSLASLAMLAGTASAATNLVGPIGDGPINPIPRAPAPACPVNANLSAPVSMNVVDSNYGLNFKLGFSATPSLIADCNKVAIDLSLATTLELGPVSDVEPIALVLTAQTDKNHKQSLVGKVMSFGFVLDSKTFTQSSANLSYYKNTNLLLPGTFHRSGSKMGSFTVLGQHISAMVDGDVTAVAEGGAYVTFEVAPTGINATVLSSATSYADASASATINGFGGEGSAHISLFWYALGGHATLAPKNGGWTGDVGYSLSMRDLLGGKLVLKIPHVASFTLFEHEASDFGGDGQKTKDFPKQF